MKTNIILIGLALSLPACMPPSPTATLSANPNTPPSAEATVPIAGDLGFGKIFGKVTDSVTDAPIPGANVTCEHFSYTSKEEDRCNRNTTTAQDGNFLFEKVFFHDTDTITLTVNAVGYNPTKIKYASFTQPTLEVDLQLTLIGSNSGEVK